VVIGGGSFRRSSNGVLALSLPTDQASLATDVAPPGSGTVTRSPNDTCYPVNTMVTLTATPATGYAFSNWSGDASGTTNPLTVTMAANKSITANFVGYPVTVSAMPPGGGSVAKDPNQPTYVPGSSVTLTAVSASGYGFTGWSGDAS